MKTRALNACAATVSVAACLLAACGGSQPPIGTPGAMALGRTTVQHADRSGSWMLPEAKSDDLLYASSGRTTVYVFAYPKGKLVGVLTGFSGANGECTDGAGNVFIANSTESDVLEYAHGGSTPINTLSDGAYWPYACSVDRVTGNLAISNLDSPSFSVFTNAQGNPVIYNTSGWGVTFCAYDGAGNLFLDGVTSQFQFAFGELPRGSGSSKILQ